MGVPETGDTQGGIPQRKYLRIRVPQYKGYPRRGLSEDGVPKEEGTQMQGVSEGERYPKREGTASWDQI